MRRVSQLVALSLVLSALPAMAQDEGGDEGGGHRRSAFKSPGGLLDRSEHTRDMEIAFFLNLPYGYGWGYYAAFPFGVGARFYYPLVADGFISSINDEFGLEGGADFTFRFSSVYGFRPLLDIPVSAVWRFHLTDKWTVYPKIGIGLGIGNLYLDAPVYFVFETVAGAIYKINEAMSLRLELGYPGVRVGLAIAL